MKKLITLLFFGLYFTFSYACSTFLLSKNGRHLFGRNYDWVTGSGMIMVNARGVTKTSFSPGSKAISWTSKYGSISFNQFGKEFPHGGMNEKGLVVELMWLDETKYPEADNRAALSELQWIQYQLDNCANVNEVIATDKIIRIDRDQSSPLHFLIADATGQAATIEFINGKMEMHKGKELPYPVLTNTPYKQAAQRFNNKPATMWTNSGDNSLDRFATACQMIQQFQQANNIENPVDFAFNILGKVAQGNYTKWSIVYDITGQQVHFVTNDHQARKSLSLSNFDFSCTKAPLAFNLNNKATGLIFNQFSPLSFNQNKAIIEQSAEESKSQIKIPSATVSGIAGYFNSVHCNN